MTPTKNKDGQPYYQGDELAEINQKDYNKRSRKKWNEEHAADYKVMSYKGTVDEHSQVSDYVDGINEEKKLTGRDKYTVSKAIKDGLIAIGALKPEE